MEKKEQQKIVSTISFNVTLITVISLVIAYYLVPQHDALKTQIADANALYLSLNDLKENGLKADGLEKILTEENKMTQGMQEILKDKAKVNKVITKTGQKDYLSWIKQEVLKGNDYSKEAQNNDQIVGNIIPVFYKYSDSNKGQATDATIREQITLDSFTNYIEEEVLKKFDIISFSPVGIENISFDSEEKPGVAKVQKTNETIGSFSFNLDFEAKNKNIMDLIDSIQKSGKLDIQNGKLMNKVKKNKENSSLSSLDNLLITIDSLTVQEPINVLDKSNKGALKLRFYVSGVGYEQLTAIKKGINEKFTNLYANILSKAKLCDNAEAAICKDNVGSQSVGSIRGLLKEATSVKIRLDTLVKDTNMVGLDINQALTSWLSLGASIDTIDTAYKKSATYIDNYNK